MQQNEVFINNDGVIEIKVNGDQTYESFGAIYDAANPLIKQLAEQNKPVRGLIDLTNKGKYTPGSNRAAMETLEHIHYEKIAFYGAEYLLKEVTELIILAMGKKDNTKVFNNREEAVRWLQSDIK